MAYLIISFCHIWPSTVQEFVAGGILPFSFSVDLSVREGSDLNCDQCLLVQMYVDTHIGSFIVIYLGMNLVYLTPTH